ncbi:MAG: NapC/NirT family cytochrome c [Deltaproteobacteria bacterium]|nr:NapC/NirT family cytochrome c [Deltaproteobacteria bacterium]
MIKRFQAFGRRRRGTTAPGPDGSSGAEAPSGRPGDAGQDPAPASRRAFAGGLYRNTLSYVGGLIVLAAAVLIVFALVGELTIKQPSPYVGIFTYLIFPAILLAGIALALYGMRREAMRRKRTGAAAELPYPRLDLNDPRQRRRFGQVLVAGSVLAVILAWVGYNAYLFTGSETFCGRICHGVMQPEYVAYSGSPHARVPCVDCHVDKGASWYVQSKISGLQQVFATTFRTYPRPIPTPIKHLRPARETCEHCHWPRKFFGATLVQIPHFRYDEKNSPEQISLLMRTGGGDPSHGEKAGIHWHMILSNTVTFAAEDPQQQRIPWMTVRAQNGHVRTYRAEATQLSAEQVAALPRHEMDCMDCHNRPSHGFAPPEGAVDRAIAFGAISPELPWIKKLAVDALVRPYRARAEAHDGIPQEIRSFYRTRYPELAARQAAVLDQAVAAVVEIFERSNFPEMNVGWSTYPDNIGHRHWPGCFRCHDGRHVSDDGKKLNSSCTACHTAPQRGPMASLGDILADPRQDWHPWEMPRKYLEIEAHGRVRCHQCHAAGFRPRRECGDCHR